MSYPVVLVPGDGIGPEVTQAARRVLDAAGAPLDWVERHAGVAALEHGEEDLFPETTATTIREIGVALKGPCTTPVGKGFRSINVSMRRGLDLFGAVRPVRSLPGVTSRYDDIDLVVIRENTEGLYSGIEHVVTEGVVTSLKVATDKACCRISRFGFEFARRNGRKKVTALHKANIMKLSDGLFLDRAREVWTKEYQDIAFDDMIIDAASMWLVLDPHRFDVLLCENLYGDIISDLCAGLVGGLGVSPGANYGEGRAVFEAVHGSAPDIAGRDLANPLAMIMSATMMLEYMADELSDPGLREIATRIDDACRSCLETGDRTRDLGGTLGTQAFTEAIIRRL